MINESSLFSNILQEDFITGKILLLLFYIKVLLKYFLRLFEKIIFLL